MKTTGLFLCLALGFGFAASAAEHLWDNFDTYPTGSIAAQPGWSRAPWINTQTAQVSSAQAYSSSNALALAWNANGCSAAYTNFLAAYDPASNHPVIRCSAKLYLQSTNIAVQFGLRNSIDGAALSFLNTNGYGLFGFTNYDVVFVPLATGRFVDVTMFYNRSNNFYRLDYDYTNRLAWGTNNAVSPLVHTQFNQFAIARLTNAVQTNGTLALDDVRVETFPPYVWAWWRCSDPSTNFVEQLGAFKPTTRVDFPDVVRAGSSDPGYDGQNDFRNDGATRELRAEPADCAILTPQTTNWTVETVFRLDPGEPNVTFLEWAKGQGFDTNGAMITFGYSASSTSFYFDVRDSEQSDENSENHSAAAPFVPDGRWHHVALVKNATVLSIYLDYQQATNITLTTSRADGSYVFNTQSRATIGKTLNNGNRSGEGTVIDEVRVSGKALLLREFIQPGQPMIASIENAEPWHVAIKGILGRTYRAETSPSIGLDAVWTPAATTTVVSTFAAFDLPYSARINFLRVLREE